MTISKYQSPLGQQIEDIFLNAYPHKLHRFVKHPLLTVASYVLLYIGSHITLTLIFGGFAGTTDLLDLTEDTTYPAGLLSLCVTIWYYLRFPTMFGKAFDVLFEEGVFRDQQIRIGASIKSIVTPRYLFWIPAILLSCVILVWQFTVTQTNYAVKSWFQINTFIYISTLVIWTIGWMALIGMLGFVIASIYVIRKILQENEMSVFRLHPDRSGGFGSLGRFSLKLSFLALVYAVFLILTAIFSTIEGSITSDHVLMLNVIVYSLFVPILFYLPLHSVHVVMVKYRDNIMRETSKYYWEEHENVYKADHPLTAEQLEEKLKVLDALKHLQEQHEHDYPTWPFSYRVRLGVFLNAITPLATTIGGIVIDKFF